jgi:ribonuclease HIII
MSVWKDYVSNIEETCGEERYYIIMLRHEKREEAIKKILEKSQILSSHSGLVFEILFQNVPMRLYKTGKVLLKKLKSKEEVEKILDQLLH